MGDVWKLPGPKLPNRQRLLSLPPRSSVVAGAERGGRNVLDALEENFGVSPRRVESCDRGRSEIPQAVGQVFDQALKAESLGLTGWGAEGLAFCKAYTPPN